MIIPCELHIKFEESLEIFSEFFHLLLNSTKNEYLSQGKRNKRFEITKRLFGFYIQAEMKNLKKTSQ
jgi:hypothetical protein